MIKSETYGIKANDCTSFYQNNGMKFESCTANPNIKTNTVNNIF